MDGDPLKTIGTLVGSLGIGAVVFVGVSFLELKRKVDGQIERGEDPYKFQVDRSQKAGAPDEPSNTARRRAAEDETAGVSVPGFRSTSRKAKANRKKGKK